MSAMASVVIADAVRSHDTVSVLQGAEYFCAIAHGEGSGNLKLGKAVTRHPRCASGYASLTHLLGINMSYRTWHLTHPPEFSAQVAGIGAAGGRPRDNALIHRFAF